ncbi:MAG TPA: hypothetical protein VGB24_02615 [Longimicrobium sp.]
MFRRAAPRPQPCDVAGWRMKMSRLPLRIAFFTSLIALVMRI